MENIIKYCFDFTFKACEGIIRNMLELFISFAKIGIMTFGGGLAMLPMFERELIDKKRWITKETLMDYYAISQCTPGVIAVNVATFVGKKEKGFWGALVATIGVVFPSIVIITILAMFFTNFSSIELVKHAFAGARVGVCVLVLNAVIKLGKSCLKNTVAIVLYIVISIVSIVWGISPIILVWIGASVGLLFMKGVNK